MALGAEPLTTTVEGRERYTVVMRFPRDSRSDPESIASQVLVSVPRGGAIHLGDVAQIERAKGPTTIRTEDGQLVTYVYVDIRDRTSGAMSMTPAARSSSRLSSTRVFRDMEWPV